MNESIENRNQKYWNRPLWLVATLAPILIVLVLGVWLSFAVKEAREAARASSCRGHLSQLWAALQNYHETYGSLPPAVIRNKQGEPMHSWRVLLLPFLERSDIYEQYDFSQPWDSPHNQKLAQSVILECYQCPSHPKIAQCSMTNYVVITGKGTAFPDTGTIRLSDIKDGLENTILLVEVANSDIHWMEPRDLSIDQMSFQINDSAKPSLSSFHPQGPAVVFADRLRACRVDASLPLDVLKSFMTISGGETFKRGDSLKTNRRSGVFLAK